MDSKPLFIWMVAILTLLIVIPACNDTTDQIAEPGVRTFAITEFPDTVGMKWTYTVYDSLTRQTDTATVSIAGNTELTNHTPVRIWVTVRGLSRDTTYVAVLGNTVEFYDTPSSNNPEVFIFPLEVGGSWGTSIDTNTVVGIDVIETPLGVFSESFHVWRRVVGLNYGLSTHTWLAPHVGIVKSSKDENDFGSSVKETWSLFSRSEE